MHRFFRPAEQVSIPRGLWREMLTQVAARGEGRRESGAFLLAAKGSRSVSEFVLYDDLDPTCLIGRIEFHNTGFSALWKLCKTRKLQPVADLHTHPRGNVAQSKMDRANPMISRDRHLALIAPEFLTRRVTREEIGVHVYGGEKGFTSHAGRAARRRVRLV